MQKLLRLLLAGLLSVWLSLKLAQCQNLDRGEYTMSFCYNTSSGEPCFTTFITNNSHPYQWKSASNYRQNIKSYVAREGPDTWYDARKECLQLGGDLASITDLQTIKTWSRLKLNQRYWIGLHRNKWICNSTGAALTYTNWEDGNPDESSDKQCICIGPKCRRVNERSICEAEHDRKWRTCNCDNNHAIVCRREENADALATKTVVAEDVLSWISADFKFYASSPVHSTSEDQTTAFASSTTGLFKSFTITEILLILLLFVTVVLIVFVVIVVIQKCKNIGRNAESALKKTDQNEAVSPKYDEIMVPDNRPSDNAVPIYTELELTQQSMPSNNTIYSKMQPTSEER